MINWLKSIFFTSRKLDVVRKRLIDAARDNGRARYKLAVSRYFKGATFYIEYDKIDRLYEDTFKEYPDSTGVPGEDQPGVQG